MALKIGIDFGGVLSIHDRGREDSTSPSLSAIVEASTGEHRSVAINMSNALEVLKTLKTLGKLYLISFAGKTRARETRESIMQTCPDIFDEMFFVKDKKFKKDVCKSLGCDIMIDDTVEILEDISKSVKGIDLLWFQGDPTFPAEIKGQKISNDGITQVQSWEEIQKFVEHRRTERNTPCPIDLNKKLY